VRQYANVGEAISNAVREYCRDVRSENFPSDAESYHSGEVLKRRKLMHIDC
jgi:ketopantoate hydroxymethyltransferase